MSDKYCQSLDLKSNFFVSKYDIRKYKSCYG